MKEVYVFNRDIENLYKEKCLYKMLFLPNNLPLKQQLDNGFTYIFFLSQIDKIEFCSLEHTKISSSLFQVLFKSVRFSILLSQ